jgi:hypothetical protein
VVADSGAGASVVGSVGSGDEEGAVDHLSSWRSLQGVLGVLRDGVVAGVVAVRAGVGEASAAAWFFRNWFRGCCRRASGDVAVQPVHHRQFPGSGVCELCERQTDARSSPSSEPLTLR